MNTTSLRTVAALTTAIAAAWSPTLVHAQAAPAAVPTAAATLLSGMTLYGTLDAAVTQRQLAGEKKVKAVNSGQMTTSFIALKGSYDLGDAYSANFDMASFVRADLGSSGRNDTDTFWSKYAWVGLGTPWGQVRLGRLSSPNWVASLRFSPFGDSTALSPNLLHTYLASPTQPMMTGHGAADSAWNNAVAYNSPVMSGVAVALMAAPSEGGTGGRRLGGSVSYGAPGQPLAAVLSVERITNASLSTPLKNTALAGAVPPLAVNDSQTLALGVSYDFKVAKAFAQWDHTELETTRAASKPTLDLKTVQLGVSVPVSRGRVLFSVAHTNKEMSAAQDESRKTYSLGYDHDLSKNVDLYAVVMRDTVTGLSSGSTLAVGGRLRF